MRSLQPAPGGAHPMFDPRRGGGTHARWRDCRRGTRCHDGLQSGIALPVSVSLKAQLDVYLVENEEKNWKGKRV